MTDFTPNFTTSDVPTGRDFDNLYDQKNISASRSRAEKKFENLGMGDIDYIKKKMKNDLLFLGTTLGYNQLSPNLHGSLAGWLQRHRGWQYKLILLPRGHYKSTIATIVDSIQMSLPYPNEQIYPYTLGPNGKYLILHEVRETASKFLFELTRAFTHKDAILAFFPELIPHKNEQRMNKYELELPRQEHHREATFGTGSSTGAEQGTHVNWMKLDDLIGKEARESPTVMSKVNDFFDNINSLLTKLEVDGWDLIGTRWAYADVYSHAMERYGISVPESVLNCIPERDREKFKDGLLKVYARGAIENGVPIFPEQFTLERLNVLRKNKLVWAAQYANNPTDSGLNEFSWPLKFYNVGSNGRLVVFTGDTSFSRSLHDLDVCVLCDPSMGQDENADETGIIVTGVDEKNNIFILETVKKRLKPPALLDELYRLYYKYRPRVISIEEVNFSGIYKYWIEDRSKQTQIFLPIRSYKTENRRKPVRIRGLAHFFSAGQVYIAEMMHDFRDEYEQFPLGDSQHLLDALAQGPNFWSRGVSSNEVESQKKAVELVADERSIQTGY